MMFAKSKEALLDLQKTLHCGKCDQHNEELLCLGECQHWFCRSCAQSSAGDPCPACGIRSRARKTHVDAQLSNVASLCSQMIKLINGHDNDASYAPINVQETVKTEGIDSKKDAQPQAIDEEKKRIPGVVNMGAKGSSESESLETDFVKLKSCRGKRNDALSDVPNIFDQMNDLITPEAKRKRRSQNSMQTPKSCEGKVKKEMENPVVGNNQSASRGVYNFEADPTAVKNTTPQSAKRRCLSKLVKRNAKGETPLQVAAIKKNIDEVKRLLEAGANPNVKDNAGWTPLHEAICVGDSDIAALLIANGASVNAPGMENSTPLHEAVVYEFANCVQLLIDNGADMFCRNAHGWSPVDFAHGKIKDMLLQATQSRFVSEVDVSLLDESSKPLCFTGSNLSKEQSKLLTNYSKAVQAKVVKELTSEVTHLITRVNEDGTCTRTNKYLKAIVTGKWIVDWQWLENSFEQNTKIPEDPFQVLGCTFHPKSGAPKKALDNRLKQLPPLLDGCQVFFYKFGSSSRREELAGLVKQGGGVVLKREPHLHNLDDYPYTHPYHAQSSVSLADCTIYVIHEDSCSNPPSVQATRMACLPVSWLVDSISKFSLLDKNLYVK